MDITNTCVRIIKQHLSSAKIKQYIVLFTLLCENVLIIREKSIVLRMTITDINNT